MELFKLLGTIAVDGTGANKAIDDVTDNAAKSESKIGKAFGSIGNAAAKVGKVVVAGLGAGAAAIGALTKMSVDAYADYEQLVGGVETLFGTGGKSASEYAKSVGKSVLEINKEYNRMNAAQDLVMRNAENAYKTAGMSMNEYMETVTGFSASLIASMGGDTLKAAEKANQAIVDMSDNANKMGSSMESIQNAYSGFAKQNYTMLDNLKLGYGGTQEEMKRLLKDAEKISGIKYDVSSYADVVDAIHVIQTEMGITGTTAKEASETIAGSATAMKSAWKNLITGMADDNADVDKLMDNLINSVAAFGKNIIPRIAKAGSKIVSTLFGYVSQGFAVLTGEAEDSAEKMAWFKKTLSGIFGDDVAEMITSAIQGVAGMVSSAFNGIKSIVSAVKTFLSNNADSIKKIIDGYIGIVKGLWDVISGLFSGDSEIISQGVSGIVGGIGNMFSGIWDLFLKFLKSFPEMWNTFWTETLPQAIATLCGCEDWEDLKQSWPRDWGEVMAGMQGIWDLFSPYIQDGIAKLCGCEDWEELKKAWPKDWKEVCGAMEEAWKVFEEKLFEGLEKLGDKLKEKWEEFREYAKGVWDDLASLASGERTVTIEPVTGNQKGSGSGAASGYLNGGAKTNTASFAYVPTANSLQSVSSNSYQQQDVAGEIRNALKNLEMSVKVDVVPDDRGIFKVVQNQAKIYSKSTGQGAFA